MSARDPGDLWIYRETVACMNGQCPRFREDRRVERRIIGDDILSVSRLVCLICGQDIPPAPVRVRPAAPGDR